MAGQERCDKATQAQRLATEISRGHNSVCVPVQHAHPGYGTTEDTALTVPVGSGVLVGDTNGGSGTLTAVRTGGNGPSHGSVTLNANGSFTYTPAADYSGVDSFTYRAYNGSQ